MLTVYFNKEKTVKQVIHLHYTFFEKRGQYECLSLAATIAHTVSEGNYSLFELEPLFQ